MREPSGLAVGASSEGSCCGEARGCVLEEHAILRAFWTGDAGLDGGEVELEGLGVLGFGRGGGVEEVLLLVVRLDERDLVFAAAGEAQVAEGFGVNREDAAGGAVLGGHVADGGAVGERELGNAGAVKFDELADDAELAQSLGDGEDEIGGRGALAQLAGEFVADDLRDQHGDGLAEHGGLGLDAADAPAEHAESVDHGGVGVGADEGVGIGEKLAVDLGGEDDAGEVLKIDLVADAHAGRNDGEVAKSRLAPLEEGVALAVALELEERICRVGRGRAVLVDLDGVVDDEFGGREGIDALGIAAESLDGVAHGGEIDDGGNAGEVLHEDAGGHVGDLAAGLGFCVPVGEEFDVGGGDVDSVFAAQQVFEQNLEAEGEAREVEAARGESGKAIDGVGAAAGGEHGLRREAVHRKILSAELAEFENERG